MKGFADDDRADRDPIRACAGFAGFKKQLCCFREQMPVKIWNLAVLPGSAENWTSTPRCLVPISRLGSSAKVVSYAAWKARQLQDGQDMMNAGFIFLS